MATPNPSDTVREPMPLAHKAGTWFIFTAIAFIVLSTLAILAPYMAGLAVTTLVGWLLLVGGVMHIISAFRGSFGRGLWQTLVGVFYLVVGYYFLTHPVIALSSLTLLLA